MKRGAIRKQDARLITVWVPVELLPIIDEAVVDLDIDRSKFIRKAIREKIAREKGDS